LKSKIINMAEKIKDAEDRFLESLLQGEAIADDGFSKRVVGKIRRRLWLRRVSLPLAAAIGASIAAKPLSSLITTFFGFLTSSMPNELAFVPAEILPSIPMMVFGALLLLTTALGFRLIDG